VSPEWRYWLEHGRQLYELTGGTTLLGRGESCHILLDDVLVSRQHARIVLDEGARVEDAGSSNGVFVNGTRVQSAELTDGDTLGIGSQRLVFRSERVRARRRAHTMAETMHGVDAPHVAEPTSVVQREPLELLAPLIDKALALGRADEAERLLEPHLRRHLESAGRDGTTSPHADRAAVYAVRLADVTRAARWVDYCFDLYGRLRLPLPAAAVEQLYATLRNVPGVNVAAHRKYVGILEEESGRLGPRERFLAQRIAGMGKLLR
jgi:hypothetical protein